MTRTAIVVGAGIGGLTAALALEQSGWDVTVMEQAPALTEIGAGIQISPNGTKIFERLGVLDAVEKVGCEAPAIQMLMGRTGRKVFTMPMGQVARQRWGAPHLNVHRADLISALASAFTGDVQTGQRIDDIRSLQADLIVGADGLHSAARQNVFGPDKPRFTGNVAWRALVPATDAPNIPLETTIWAGSRRHAITNRVRGTELINFVGIVETPIESVENWDAAEPNTQALNDFAGWHTDLVGLIHAIPQLNRWPLYDRAPLSNWVDGNVALLGDAVHPMLPSMAQGAVQAIEDAWVLARASELAPVTRALKRYEQLRQPRATKVQVLSAKNLRQFHKSGLGALATYVPMALVSRLVPQMLYTRPDWVYRVNPDDWQRWV